MPNFEYVVKLTKNTMKEEPEFTFDSIQEVNIFLDIAFKNGYDIKIKSRRIR